MKGGRRETEREAVRRRPDQGATMRLHSIFAAITLAVCLSASSSTLLAQRDKKAELQLRVQKLRDTVQMLSDRLRTELSAATRSGAIAAAIEACRTLSPDLTSIVADESSVELIRTSLKVRNPDNAPDEWEEQVLQSFQKQASSGTEIGKLEHYEVVTTPEGDRMLRYMKAIPIGETCLACHGNDVKMDVKAEIARLYPEDKAIGYKLGELRGAFSVIQLIQD
jgi:Protein of unknown function (DUF3365)